METCWLLALLTALPAHAQPTLQFTAIRALASNQVELVWSSDTNRLFAVERSADPGDWDNALCVAIPEPSAQFASNRWAGAMDTTPGFFRLLASPPLDPSVISHTALGTPTNDTQSVIGTTNRDYVMQFGNAGEDTQYASASDGSDWIHQTGGAGTDTQTGRGGSGNDFIHQEGGDGNDVQYVQGGDGDDGIVQKGGDGDDNIRADMGEGSDSILQCGGAGHDWLKLEGGPNDGTDLARFYGGTGDDTIEIDIARNDAAANDALWVDGGADSDTLIIIHLSEIGETVDVQIELMDGTLLYSSGTNGAVITVVDVEFIYLKDAEENTIWSWSAP